MIGYVLTTFPQLSESFIEGELRVLGELGVERAVVSLRRPAPELAGPTELSPETLSYVPGVVVVALSFVRWAVVRPVTMARNLISALRLRSLTMLRGAWLAPWIASRFRKERATHLHAHFATDAASAALPTAALLGITVSFTIHARELYLRTNGLCERVRRADLVVTVCRYNVEQLRRRCPAATVEVVHCGVDLDRFPLRPDPGSRDGLRLLSVGRLVEKKGYADLVDAVAILRGEGVDVTCEIIGGGPLQAELAERIAAAGLGGVVQLAGRRLPEQVASAMRDCDVFVLPCVVAANGDRDSMPVVLKEAMAIGVPVVATDEVGIPEFVDDAVGRLARPRDPRSLADAIAQVAALRAHERRALGEAGRRRVARDLDLRAETVRLKELFDRIGS